jgi:hypothetical protein
MEVDPVTSVLIDETWQVVPGDCLDERGNVITGDLKDIVVATNHGDEVVIMLAVMEDFDAFIDALREQRRANMAAWEAAGKPARQAGY